MVYMIVAARGTHGSSIANFPCVYANMVMCTPLHGMKYIGLYIMGSAKWSLGLGNSENNTLMLLVKRTLPLLLILG